MERLSISSSSGGGGGGAPQFLLPLSLYRTVVVVLRPAVAAEDRQARLPWREAAREEVPQAAGEQEGLLRAVWACQAVPLMVVLVLPRPGGHLEALVHCCLGGHRRVALLFRPEEPAAVPEEAFFQVVVFFQVDLLGLQEVFFQAGLLGLLGPEEVFFQAGLLEVFFQVGLLGPEEVFFQVGLLGPEEVFFQAVPQEVLQQVGHVRQHVVEEVFFLQGRQGLVEVSSTVPPQPASGAGLSSAHLVFLFPLEVWEAVSSTVLLRQPASGAGLSSAHLLFLFPLEVWEAVFSTVLLRQPASEAGLSSAHLLFLFPLEVWEAVFSTVLLLAACLGGGTLLGGPLLPLGRGGGPSLPLGRGGGPLGGTCDPAGLSAGGGCFASGGRLDGGTGPCLAGGPCLGGCLVGGLCCGGARDGGVMVVHVMVVHVMVVHVMVVEPVMVAVPVLVAHVLVAHVKVVVPVMVVEPLKVVALMEAHVAAAKTVH